MGGMSGQLKLALSGSLCLLVALAGWSWCLVASGLVGLVFPFEGAVPRIGLSVSPVLGRSLRDGAFPTCRALTWRRSDYDDWLFFFDVLMDVAGCAFSYVVLVCGSGT